MLTLAPVSKQIYVGGHDFTVTALPLGVLRRVILPMSSKFNTSATDIDDDTFAVMLKYIHMSVSKAEPEISLEDLENTLLLSDFTALFQAVIEVSGLLRDTAGEVERPLSLPSSGDGSTGMSSAAQDGHTNTWMGS